MRLYKVTLKKDVTFWKSEGHETKEATFNFKCEDKSKLLVLISAMASTTEEDLELTVSREV